MPDSGHVDLLTEAWATLADDDGTAAQNDPVKVAGGTGTLRARLPVEDTAVACVGVALMAGSALYRQRAGPAGHLRVDLDREHIAAAVRSERHFHRAGQPAGTGFAPLSRFWETSHGWLRTHANYPWHREALCSTLGTSGDVDDVAAALRERRAEDVEAAVFAGGGIAVAVRSLDEWRAHAQGRAVGGEPLISHRAVGEAQPRARLPAELPASGVRVLDLTRVIAGPVCTRYLAALGAEVLRLDPPHRPDMNPGDPADTLLGKRSAILDLDSRSGTETLHLLLDGADVVICGYRPGALDQYGLGGDELAARHPGLVAVYLNAWGHHGPWAQRRGFDSVVQVATGIAMVESTDGKEPGVLPCQLLDHGTGYLAAAAALDGLRRQAEDGGTHVRQVSLARTAGWLTSRPVGQAPVGARAEGGEAAWLVRLDSATGPVTAVAPPGRLGDHQLRWPRSCTGYGDDPPEWC